MAGAKICGDSNVPVLLQSEKFPCSPEVLESFWIPSSSSALHGSNSMGNLEEVSVGDTIDVPFLHQITGEEDMKEDVHGLLHPRAKKRRLTAGQVHVLEKSFEVDNKLNTERKVQLAKELGLQPRQVAIWFQNRRARLKNKQLEKDCDSLRASYGKLKTDYDSLLKENENLRNQVSSLKEKLLLQANRKEAIKSSETESKSRALIETSENLCTGQTMEVKQEDASSARSDVFDSETPQYGSCHVLEPEQSEFSQKEEEDGLRKSFLDTTCFKKLEGDDYTYDPPAISCTLGFSAEDQPVWSWLY